MPYINVSITQLWAKCWRCLVTLCETCKTIPSHMYWERNKLLIFILIGTSCSLIHLTGRRKCYNSKTLYPTLINNLICIKLI